MTCLICQCPLTLGSYRLVAIQRDGETWLSRYACRGTCTEQALGQGGGAVSRLAADALPVSDALATAPMPSLETSPLEVAP